MYYLLYFIAIVFTLCECIVFPSLSSASGIIEFPDSEGVMHRVDLNAEPELSTLRRINTNPANNLYLLFTRRNRELAQVLVYNDVNSVNSSNFNPTVPTVVVSHGWLGSRTSKINEVLRNALLDESDVNVIILDWSRLSKSDYVTAARGVPIIGRGLGHFLNFLHTVTGAPYTSMHLVGFSLGAHVVGNAGRELGGQVARITGLDPAGPLWYTNEERLAPSDGVYVEAIHTNAGSLGIALNVANVDFYPNGGSSQPGCSTTYCNHDRSWELFGASISHNHLIGNNCSNNRQLISNTCRGQQFPMGNNDLNKFGVGVYRLKTKRRFPY